jgi:hypothetical protein
MLSYFSQMSHTHTHTHTHIHTQTNKQTTSSRSSLRRQYRTGLCIMDCSRLCISWLHVDHRSLNALHKNTEVLILKASYCKYFYVTWTSPTYRTNRITKTPWRRIREPCQEQSFHQKVQLDPRHAAFGFSGSPSDLVATASCLVGSLDASYTLSNLVVLDSGDCDRRRTASATPNFECQEEEIRSQIL